MSVSDIPATLRTESHQHEPVICFEPGIARREGSDSRFVEDMCGTLRAVMGDNQPAVCYGIDQQGGKSNCCYAENIMPTLLSDSHGTPHAVCFKKKKNDTIYVFKERAGCPGGGKGILIAENKAFTLATNFNGAICYEAKEHH